MVKRSPRKKTPTYAQLKKRLDGLLSLWVRRKDADHRGYVVCCSCGAVDHWKNMDCGHFVSRVWLATRFNERNVAVQCKTCNGAWGKAMNVAGFGAYLVSKYGPGILRELDFAKRGQMKLNRSDLLSKIEDYQAKIAALG